jgi:hypothetical protein
MGSFLLQLVSLLQFLLTSDNSNGHLNKEVPGFLRVSPRMRSPHPPMHACGESFVMTLSSAQADSSRHGSWLNTDCDVTATIFTDEILLNAPSLLNSVHTFCNVSSNFPQKDQRSILLKDLKITGVRFPFDTLQQHVSVNAVMFTEHFRGETSEICYFHVHRHFITSSTMSITALRRWDTCVLMFSRRWL